MALKHEVSTWKVRPSLHGPRTMLVLVLRVCGRMIAILVTDDCRLLRGSLRRCRSITTHRVSAVVHSRCLMITSSTTSGGASLTRPPARKLRRRFAMDSPARITGKTAITACRQNAKEKRVLFGREVKNPDQLGGHMVSRGNRWSQGSRRPWRAGANQHRRL